MTHPDRDKKVYGWPGPPTIWKSGNRQVIPMDITPPDACASMDELRIAIDALDARLVGLLARRQAYIERAAILKNDRTQVRDPARIEDVVRKVVAEGAGQGLSPAIAEAVWRALIEASIAHEYAAFDEREK
jgi:isochorismate pyruvate lyase